MRRKLLLGLVAGALPFLCAAKENIASPAVQNSLHFQENKGQVTDQYNHSRTDIQFSIGGNGMKVFIGDGQLHYQFSNVTNKQSFRGSLLSSANADVKLEAPSVDMYRMDVELLNANKNAQVITEQKQDFSTNYYQASLTGRNSQVKMDKAISVASYDKITYRNIYPNIDWVLFVRNNQLEYEFVVRPGGDPANIKLKYGGATSLRINNEGQLMATTPKGTVTEAAPVSFQADGRNVATSFKLNGNVMSFDVANYSGTLTIDPLLSWGTYFGDVATDELKSVAYDNTGNAYFVGYTLSTTNMATIGAYQTANAGSYDFYLFKTTAAGVLVWSTFYGTTGIDVGFSVNYNGTDVVIAGYTDFYGDLDALLAKFSTTGAWSYGWAFGDIADEVCFKVDRAGTSSTIYMSGRTTGTTPIATVGQTLFGGGTYDAFLMQTDAAGIMQWGTLLGSTGDESGVCVDVDGTGNAYLGGWTNSTTTIATTGSAQQFAGGMYDGYIAKYSSSGVKIWGTYWGGAADDNILGGKLDGSANIHVTGISGSTGMATTGAYQTTMNGVNDAIIGKYTTAGVKLWGTYYGGSGYDEGDGITLDGTGVVFVAGYTESPANIANTNSYDVTYGGVSDGFVARFGAGGAFGWGTYYGGTLADWMNNIAADNNNPANVYVAGYSESGTDIALNTTIQTTNGGLGDGVAAKFLDCMPTSQPGVISGTFTVCAGSTQTYTIATVAGANSYTWTLPNGWTGTSSTNSITVTVGTTGGSISVVAVNACGNSAPQTQSVTVNPVPTATITPGGPTTFCQGGSVVLSATTGTGYTYQWYQGAPLPGATNSTYTASASGNYTVQITANGCSATSSQVTVTVNPLPNASASNTGPVCAGQPLTLNGSSTTSGVTYDWTGPNNYNNTQNPFIATTVVGDAGTYTLTVTDGNNCTATATTTVVITAGAPATPSAISGPLAVCENSSNTYSVTNDVNATQYNWTLPTGWSGTSTTNSINTTAGTTGGTISVTAQNGCGTSSASSITVTVNPLPTPTVIQAGSSLTTTTTYNTYQWYNTSGPISGATSQSYTPTVSGTYYVVVTDGNGCSGQAPNFTFSTSVANVAGQGAISLYPNPNSGSFTVSGAFRSNDGKVNVEVVDIAGRIVHKGQVTIKANVIATEISISAQLAPGVYTLKLSSDAQTAAMPFVKK